MIKRRFNELEYEERFSKKARFAASEESIEDKLDELIVKIGEKNTSSIDKNIQDLSEIFNFDLLPKNSRIVNVFCECIVEYPQKICIYSTLIGLLNARNYAFGGLVVEKIIWNFSNYMKIGEFENARIMARFLSDLINTRVVSSASLINLYENLVDVTLEDNIPQVRSDYFVYIVLSTLPFVGKELYEKKEQELDQILNTIDSYMSKRSKIEYHSALKVWHSNHPHAQEEYLSCLWTQITKLRQEKWSEHHIYRPYIHFDNILCEAVQNNIPIIKPPSYDSSLVYPYPQVVFRLFDYTDCPERSILPGTHSIERFLIEDNLRFILNKNYYDRKDCASSFLNYTNLSISTKIPLEYIIVEVIFGELFALPKSKLPEICYGSLLLDLCKLQPSTFPQVLAQAVELLFDRLDMMNGSCINRFASWFAYHLSNFQFRWGWDDWSIALKNEPLHQKTKFINETLHYCLRLSYHTKVLESVPETFHKLAPVLPKAINKYLIEENDSKVLIKNNVKDQVNSLTTALSQKCTSDEASDLLSETIVHDDPNVNLITKIEIFITCLLNVSSKSMTHTFAFIAKYLTVLKELNKNEEAQLCILDTILEVWKSHQQMICILIQKLVKSGVLDSQNVAIWVFSKANHEEFMKFYFWEILHTIIKRTVKNVKMCVKELDEAKDKLNQITDDQMSETAENDKTCEEIESLEEKLDTFQTEQKNLFLVIFQKFTIILTEHIQSCELQGESFKNYWFFWTLSRLQEILFQYNEHIFKHISTYESLVFTNELDQNILLIFKQLLYLRA